MELLGVLLFLLGLLASIALHELGHLLPAKRFGVRVTQYMVGFGPTLWSRNRGGTEYGIKAIPLGGYIRMVGMFPPTGAQPDANSRFASLVAAARAEAQAEVPDGAERTAFYSLSVPRKLTVMAGGPFMNLVLAVVLFTVALCAVGVATPTPTVSSVVPCSPSAANPTGIASNDGGCADGERSPAAASGLRAGDLVVSVAGQPIAEWQDIGAALVGRAGQQVEVVVRRSGADVGLSADIVEIPDGQGGSRAFLGVSPTFALVTVPATVALSQLAQMGTQSIQHLATFPAQVGQLAVGLVTGQERDPEGPVSVVGVGRISGEIAAAPGIAARDKISSYLGLLASLNLFLFIFNLVPLLPLDGGHIAGALFEGARRSVARLRGRAPTGPVDTARMLPLAYLVSVALLVMSLVVMVSDIVDPITLR